MTQTTSDTPDLKPRSRDVTDGLEKAAARGMLRAVGMGDDELPIHGFAAHEVEEKGLAGAVFSDHQPKRRATFGDAVQVFVECGDFGVAANLNMPGTKTGRDAGTQGLNESVAFTWTEGGAKHVE